MSRKISSAKKEMLFRELFLDSGKLIIISNNNRVIESVNPLYLKETGFDERSIIGEKDSVLFKREKRASYTSMVFKNLPEQKVWEGEIEFLKSDRAVFQRTAVIKAYFSSKGDYRGYFLIADKPNTHFTSVRQQETADRTYKDILSSIHDAVFVLNPHGKITYTNSAFCKMFGCSTKECIGLSFVSLLINKMEMEKFEYALKTLSRSETLSNFLLAGKSKNGNRIIISNTFSQLRDNEGRMTGCVVTARDVTGVQYGEELRRSHERLELLVNEVERKTTVIGVLNEIHKTVIHNPSVNKIIRTSIEGIKRIIEHDLAGIYVYDPVHKDLYPHTVSKQTKFSRRLARFPLTIGEGIIGRAAMSGKLILVNNAQNDPRSKYPIGMKPNLEHFIAAPLKIGKRFFGVLVIARNRDPEFIDEEAQLVQSFADATTSALENCYLVSQLSEIRKDRNEHGTRNIKNEANSIFHRKKNQG